MPMISSVTNAALSQKPDNNKSMGICLTANNTGVEFTTTNIAGLNNNSTNMRNSNNTGNPPTSAANFFAPANVASQIRPMATTVMLAKLPHNSATNVRQQAVIIQPRPAASIGSGKAPIRVPAAVIASNNVVPVSSSTISVRTRLVSPNQHCVPVLNLSQSGTSGAFAPMVTNVKQIVTSTGQKLMSNESLNLVINTNNNTPTNSAINLKTNANSSDDLKTSATSLPTNVQSLHINKVNKLIPTVTAQASGAIVTNQPRMISINNAGQGQTARVEILNTNVANKSALVNNYKTFIISSQNPPSSETLLVGSNLNFTTNKISVASNSQLMAATASRENVNATNTFNNTVGVHQQQSIIAGKPTILTMATPTGGAPGTSNLFNNQNSLSMAGTHLAYQPGIVSNTGNTTSFATFDPAPSSSVTVTSLPVSLFSTQSKAAISTTSGITGSLKTKFVGSRKRLPNDYLATSSASTTIIPNGSMSSQSSAYNLSQVQSIKIANFIGGHASSSSSTIFSNSENPADSPRKKQRKQMFEPTTLMDQDLETKSPIPNENGEAMDISNNCNNHDNPEQLVTVMRSRPLLYQPDQAPNVRRICQHFMRYSDVKLDVKTKSSSNKRSELLSDVKKQTGFRNLLISKQLNQGAEEEENCFKNVLEQFLFLLETEISPNSKAAATSTLYGNPESAEKLSKIDQMCMKINDLTRANIQRTNIIIENYNSAKQMLITLTEDHKDKMATITKKITHKRSFIK